MDPVSTVTAPLTRPSIYLPSFYTYAGVMLTWLSIRPWVLLLLMRVLVWLGAQLEERANGSTLLRHMSNSGNGDVTIGEAYLGAVDRAPDGGGAQAGESGGSGV